MVSSVLQKKKIRILFLEINELRVHFMSNPIYLDLQLNVKLQCFCHVQDFIYIADVNCPEIHHGESFVDRKSVFQGHIASISHTKQVMFLSKYFLFKKKTIPYSLFFQGFKKEITNLLHNVSGKDCKYRHMYCSMSSSICQQSIRKNNFPI